jgi:transposase-like protein
MFTKQVSGRARARYPVPEIAGQEPNPSFRTLHAKRLFVRAISRTRVSPTEVTTDRYRVYPHVLDERLPAAFHRTEAHANNPLETDHGPLEARLRPIAGLKRD